MGVIKWLGRVTLWVVFLPLGLWRSIRHGKNKRQAEVLRAIQAQGQLQAPPQYIRGIPSDDLPAAP